MSIETQSAPGSRIIDASVHVFFEYNQDMQLILGAGSDIAPRPRAAGARPSRGEQDPKPTLKEGGEMAEAEIEINGGVVVYEFVG